MIRKRINTDLKKVLFILMIVPANFIFGANNDQILLKAAQQVSGPLPDNMASEQNPITPEKEFLGKMLFYETRISVDGTVSCARCHPFSLFAADGLARSIGHDCQLNQRNAPTILNAAGQISAHWTGNRLGVEDQAKQSVVGPTGFGMPSYAAVENKLKAIKGYAPFFQKAFPGEKDPISVDNFAKAVGAFERALVTPSPFDAFLKGKTASLTSQQKAGLSTFLETGCINCHSGEYLGGKSYRKFGVFESYWQYTKSKNIDEGRYTVTKSESDMYVFKVPILRNVGMTSPYFHDGSVERLHDTVGIMGKVQLGKDLTDSEIEDVVLFLRSLTGKISGEALMVPILPVSE
jgi:cytochrome c peroxidase